MTSSVEITTGYLAMITRVIDHRISVVPGLETNFSGYPVVVYNSAKLLLEKLLRPTTVLPTVIVVDLSKSPDCGLHFLREIKAHERLRSIPVLMRRITADSSKGIQIPVRKWGDASTSHFNWEQQLQIAS
ncbi:hypothetical protein GCM10027347_14870 [Larkinella harenae]